MKKIFESVNVKNPRHSAFDLSHERKQSMQFGKLTPCLIEEVVPGDHYSVKTETMVRMQPMIAPIMERVDLYLHYFFVPSRILWDSWEDFITGGDDGLSAPTMPVLGINNATKGGLGTIADYFGIPTNAGGVQQGISINALPHRAYWLIWNEYYRDQNLQTPVDISLAVPADEFYALATRAWGKDYFTSALPSPQKGPAVSLPVTGTFSPQYKTVTEVTDEFGTPATSGSNIGVGSTGELAYETPTPVDGQIHNLVDPQVVDSTSFTIEELRRSARLQEWLELAARGGSRLKELIRNFFGVSIGDGRIDRPEYLGGGKTPIMISEVLNTTGIIDAGESEVGQPQGTMAGHGLASSAKNGFSYKIKEHGYIMAIGSIMPQATYSQGVHRMWKRGVEINGENGGKMDYYWPQFANIGEQAVLNHEIYHNYGTGTSNDETFGYQQRYAEYKYKCNSVHGDFRDTLDFWTLARKFATRPALNEEFIQCDDAELQAIFAVSETQAPYTDKFLVQMYHQVKARRPMPYFSTPEL